MRNHMDRLTVIFLSSCAALTALYFLYTPTETKPNSPSNNGEFITWQELEEMPASVKGYGLTVFKGTRVEKFEVEYDGTVPHPILKNEKMILVRMGYPLIGSQVLAGMSGSPVYFKKDGKWKLAGAIAFGFQIPVSGKSLGGITPIQAMISQRKTDFGRRPDSSKELEERYLRLKSQNLTDPASQRKFGEVRSQLISGLSDPITVGTHDGAKIILLQPVFFLSTKSGATVKESEKVEKPKPGDAITMMLVDGDINLGGTCTVTYVTEDKFWACGHPILMDGPVIAPARKSSIATSYKGPFEAFKMVGDQHESVGYISYDGTFAIEGVLKKAPENAMLPVNINVDLNGQPIAINYRVFRHKIYSEALIGQVGTQAMEPRWNPRRKAATSAQSVISYDGKSLKLYGSSSAGPPIMLGPFMIMSDPWSAISRTAQFAGRLLSSEWNFDVKKIEMNIRLKEGEGALLLDSLKVLNDKNQPIDSVSPGDSIQLIIALRTGQGTKNFITKVPIKLPSDINVKKNNLPSDEGLTILIAVESGNCYTERDEKKISAGVPENKDIFVNQLMINERDPGKLFIQVVLPPTKIDSESPKALAGDYKNSWHKVTTLNFLRSVNSIERKIILKELESPIPGYILNVDGNIKLHLNLIAPTTQQNPTKP